LDLFKTPFEGFAPADFDCYIPDKWSSRLYNRARMDVVNKLNALGRLATERLAQEGLTVEPETNHPIPSVFNNHAVDAQWLFLTRGKEDRRELSTFIDRQHSVADNLRDAAHYKRHLMLAVKIHESGVDVLLGLHRHAWIDAQNGANKLQRQPEEGAALLAELVQGGGEDLHLVGPLGVVALTDCDADTLRQSFEALSEDHEWLILGRNHDPEDPALAEASFADEVCDLLAALAPLYRFLLWSRDNDHVALRGELQEHKEEMAQGGGISEGDEVRITSGLFSGRTGVVQEFEKKGMVKVKMGTMVIQVKAEALKPM
jgi:hypothetical protein